MDLSETLNNYPELIQFDFQGNTKEEIIRKLVKLLDRNQLLVDSKQFEEDVFIRERECSTGIGMGIAIPHAKSKGVKTPCFTIIKLAQNVDWDSLDGEPAKLVIMLAVPETNPSGFLKLLSTLSYNLMDDKFRNSLFEAKTHQDILSQFIDLKQIEL